MKSTKKHGKCLQKVQLRMPLHFANEYSYRKQVSIWVRLRKQDEMKIVVLEQYYE